MGGIGSGNYGGRPTVEGSLTLDLSRLLRDGSLRPGHSVKGSVSWTRDPSGEPVASVGYEAHLSDTTGRLRLLYQVTDNATGEARRHETTVTLVTVPQPFGGRRWWFLCPSTGRRVGKLHLPSGASTFASRKAYRLAYRSQRQTPRDRALAQAFKRRRRLGDYGAIGNPIDKPHGMRWRTFDRAVERIEAHEEQATAHLWIALQKMSQRRGR
jgi:hypothetical protein